MSRNLSHYFPQLDDIPELQTNKENWDDGQFDDTEFLYISYLIARLKRGTGIYGLLGTSATV